MHEAAARGISPQTLKPRVAAGRAHTGSGIWRKKKLRLKHRGTAHSAAFISPAQINPSHCETNPSLTRAEPVQHERTGKREAKNKSKKKVLFPDKSAPKLKKPRP